VVGTLFGVVEKGRYCIVLYCGDKLIRQPPRVHSAIYTVPRGGGR
jgi:hypothetical protein